VVETRRDKLIHAPSSAIKPLMVSPPLPMIFPILAGSTCKVFVLGTLSDNACGVQDVEPRLARLRERLLERRRLEPELLDVELEGRDAVP